MDNKPNHPLDVVWICPDCRATNLDAFDLTAEPTCWSCDSSGHQWEQIVGDAEVARLNVVWAKLPHRLMRALLPPMP